jgi:hypothetical protein
VILISNKDLQPFGTLNLQNPAAEPLQRVSRPEKRLSKVSTPWRNNFHPVGAKIVSRAMRRGQPQFSPLRDQSSQHHITDSRQRSALVVTAKRLFEVNQITQIDLERVTGKIH